MRPAAIYMTGQGGDLGTILATLYRQAGVEVLEPGHQGPAQAKRLLHLAAKSPPATDAQLYNSNQEYLAEILTWAKDRGVDEVVFFSAVAVYGEQDQEDVDESTPPLNPGLYGQTKLWGEQWLRRSGLRCLCLRLPAVLGGSKLAHLPGRWLAALSRGERLTLTNAQRLFNNFLEIEDLFHFLLRVDLRPGWDAVNLAVDKSMSLEQVARTIRDWAELEGELETHDQGGPFFNLSTAKAQARYGFIPGEPAASLERWLRRMSLGLVCPNLHANQVDG